MNKLQEVSQLTTYTMQIPLIENAVRAKRSSVNFNPHHSAEKRMTSEKIHLRFIFIYYNITQFFRQHFSYMNNRPSLRREKLCILCIPQWEWWRSAPWVATPRGKHQEQGVSGSPSLAQNRFTHSAAADTPCTGDNPDTSICTQFERPTQFHVRCNSIVWED
jgi:hypothetical protein